MSPPDMTGEYRYAALDGVRGLAAQVVLIGHLVNFAVPNAPDGLAVAVSWSARLAVMVFFVLSGFVIALSLRGLAFAYPRGYLTHYAVHRVARILPPLVLAVALAFLVAILARATGLHLIELRNAELDTGLAAFLRGITLTFRQTDATWGINGPLWSLRQEVYLYAVAALASLILLRSGAWRLLAGAGVAAMIVLAAPRFFYLQSAALFGCGALAALYGHLPILRRAARSPLPPLAVAAMIAAPVIALPSGLPFLTAQSNDPFFLAWQGLMALPLALTLLGLALDERGASLALARLQGLGRYSYTLYVSHNPLLVLFYSVLAAAGLQGGPLAALGFALLAFLLAQALGKAGALVLERPADYRRALWKALSLLGVPRPAGPARG